MRFTKKVDKPWKYEYSRTELRDERLPNPCKHLYLGDIDFVKKLGELEDLEEQIDCPLDFVATPYKLSGLKKIWYHNQWCEVVRIVVYEEATKPYMEVRCKDYKYLKMILLEDYGVTWAFTREELKKPKEN